MLVLDMKKVEKKVVIGSAVFGAVASFVPVFQYTGIMDHVCIAGLLTAAAVGFFTRGVNAIKLERK